MIVSAPVAIYPLRQDRLTPGVTAVSAALQAAGLAGSAMCEAEGRPDLFEVQKVVLGPVVEELIDAEPAILGVAAGGTSLGGAEAPDKGNRVGAQGGKGIQDGARVGAAMAEPGRPLLLIPGRDAGTRLGGELADAKAERDLAVQQMGEDLDHRPFARLRTAWRVLAPPRGRSGGGRSPARRGPGRRRGGDGLHGTSGKSGAP
jgi:hypothetical protein